MVTDANKSPLPTENMSTDGQSPGQLATSPTTSMETNHPSPPKDNLVEQQQTTTDAEITATTEQILLSTTEEPAATATVAAIVPPPAAADTTADAVAVTTVPPAEPEVEWTTLVIDGREFRVPKALEIDPSFLAALPEEMRQEILTDQVRNFEREENQRRAQRAAAYAAANPTANLNPLSTDGTSADNSSSRTNEITNEAVIGEMLGEINPEFISALPPEIREELLAERRRTAATMAAMNGVNLPDSDPAEFLRTLQPHLRQQVLADMEESQISALPEDMANEARALRAAMETQQQQYLRDRVVRNHNDVINMLSNTHSTRPIRMYNLRALQEARNNRADRHSSNWYSFRTGTNTAELNSNASAINSRGRQLLDNESICCLLILLFVDDTRLSFTRLQKVLKNLCHHAQTRQWIIKALLSIINKSTGQTEYDGPTSTPDAPTLILKSSSINGQSQAAITTNNNNNSTNVNDISQIKNINPSWLTINFESAFGARTNVFRIQRLGHTKRLGSVQISVHAQACPIVCRQVLESLIILAKTFPEQFLPLPLNNNDQQQQQSAVVPSNENITKTSSPDKQTVTTPSKTASNIRDLSFWELILKLDQSFNNRAGRSSTNPLQNISSIIVPSSNYNNTNQRTELTLNINSTTTNTEIDFKSSPLAALLFMLDHPILNKNNQLMDKLFKLLSLISQSFQVHIRTKKDVSPIPLAASTPMTTEPTIQSTTNTTDCIHQRSNNQALSTNTNNKLVISDDQVVLDSQLDLVIKALISKSCTEDGLEFATMLLLNISKINQATRDKVLHLLLNGIRLLGRDVSEEIK